MKVLIETSTLTSASISWLHKGERGYEKVEHPHYKKCRAIFDYVKNMGIKEVLIITETVENHVKDIMFNAVESTIKKLRPLNIKRRYNMMVFQYIICNDSLDVLDYYLEECSIRKRYTKLKMRLLRRVEIIPYLKAIVSDTKRYRPEPRLTRVIKSRSLRRLLKRRMSEGLPKKGGIIYPGMPTFIKIIIMTEATMLYRELKGAEEVYIASCDNHFKPNLVQIGSYLSPQMFFTGELDSTIRDKLASKFGFIGEDPDLILPLLKAEYGS